MKKKKNKFHTVLYSLLVILLGVMLLSTVLSIFGISVEQAEIVNENIETTLITVRNIFSKEGIRNLLNNVLVNFGMFQPILNLIIALIGIGLGEASGLFKAIFTPISKLKPKYVTFLILLVSIIAGFFGEASYVFIIPMAGILYKYLNRSSILGLIIAFIGMTIGYGTNIFIGYDVQLLGELTQLAARIDVDKNFIFNINSMLYIMISSTIILSVIGTIIIESKLVDKIEREKKVEDELEYSKKGINYTFIIFIILLSLIVYGIIPNLPGSGLLLDITQTNYLSKLFSTSAPFRESFTLIVTIIISICSMVYGKLSGNLRGSEQYTEKIGSHFDKLGYTFILLFVVSQIMGVINWTNLGSVISIFLVNILSQLSMSGLFLIISLFIITIISSILMPGTLAKWTIFSPTIVPLFMRANITPEFTQFIFMAADGIGKILTPIFPYFIILLGFIYKYGDEKINLGKIYKTTFSTTILLLLIWLLIIIGWYIVGLPLGIGGTTTI